MAEKKKSQNFTMIPNKLIKEEDSLTIHLYTLIHHFETQKGETCFLSIKAFCKYTKAGEKKVRKALKQLEEKGYVVSATVKGYSTCRNTTEKGFEMADNLRSNDQTGVRSNSGGVMQSNDQTGVRSNSRMNKNNINNIEKNKKKEIFIKEKTECKKTFKNWNYDEFNIEVHQDIFCDQYPEKIDSFLAYWSETDENGKMRVNKEKAWNTAARLYSWSVPKGAIEQHEKRMRDLIAGRGLSHDPKDFGEADPA